MATNAYGLKSNTNFIITSNTLYQIGRDWRLNTTFLHQVTTQTAPGQQTPLGNWSQVSANQYFNLALQTDGTLWSWGNNSYGQLGLSDQTHRSSPTQVGTSSNWVQISAGSVNSFAIQTNGTLWAWGNNSWGQLGTSNQTNYSSPVQIGALSVWTKIAASYNTSYGIQSNGTLWAWGSNSFGQLGINSTIGTSVVSPVQIGASVSLLSNWTQVAAGQYFAVALQSNGTLWAWGQNNLGQLGLGNTTNYSGPTQVGGLSQWTQITSGLFHVAGIQSNGTLWGWGYNNYGNLGQGNTGNYSIPVQIGNLSNWYQISCGYYSTAAIQSNRILWTVGLTSFGMLGYDVTSYRSYVTQIGNSGIWTRFPSGSQNNLWGAAINTNNNLYVWGTNTNRLLNYNYSYYDTTETLGNCNYIVSPVPLDPTLSTPIKSVAIGDQFGVYVQSNGTLWAWGANSYGQIPQPWGTVPTLMLGNNWIKIANGTGLQYAAGIQSNGTLWTWGVNSYGQLGNLTQNLAAPAPLPPGPSKWTDISAGIYQMGGLQSPGTLWMWGNNSYGQLGQSDQTNRSSPIQVGAVSTWTQLAVGDYHTAALQTDGTLWSWGYNFYGQIGRGNTTNYLSPVQIGGALVGTIWTQTALAFGSGTHALASNGTLYAYGYGGQGALGVNSTTSFSSPVQVPSLSSGWANLYYGMASRAAILSNGTLWVCGYNNSGILGLSDTTNRLSFVQVGALSTWSSVVIGGSSSGSYALQSNGTLWSWGPNSFGQLGSSNTTSRSSPVQVGAATNWTAVDGGNLRFLGIRGGQLWTCGYNQATAGTLGLGYSVNTTVYSPTQIGALTSWAKIAVGFYHSLALQSNGTLWSWGYNVQGNLGLGDVTQRSSPVQIGTLSNWASIYAGGKNGLQYSFSMALKTDGTLWAWGNNSFGQLGINTTTAIISSPVQIPTSGLGGWAQVSCGYFHTVMVLSNNTMWTCGYNNNGQLGQGNSGSTPSRSPVQVGTNTSPASTAIWNIVAAGNYHSVGVQSGGTLWGWGNNSYGQLGTLNQTNYSSPVQAAAYTNTWIQTANGNYSTIAIRNDNTLWTWGNNSYGQLGLGDLTDRLTPVQIGILSNWAQVGCGANYVTAIQSDGTLWAWGSNSWGQLGLSDTANRSTPTQVGVANTWKTVQIGTGNSTTLAIQNNGTLWGWGLNSYGQLGTSDQTNYSSPVQIGALSVWTKVAVSFSHTVALQSNGTLWSWGQNGYGQLALNTTTNYSSPIQVGGVWSQIAVGYQYTHAINSNGTLWGCGYNLFGNVGNNSTSVSLGVSTLVQVGALNSWTQITDSSQFSMALQNNGTLWTWGLNGQGALGLNTSTNYSSPVQVGTDTSWLRTSASFYSTTATKGDGAIWSWGNSSYGQLGNNSKINFSSPIQTTSPTVVNIAAKLSAGVYYSASVAPNGTLWTWGCNSWGVLGQGDLTHRSSPTQVGSLSNWSTIVTGQINAAAVKTDGTLWAWGNNSYSQFGNNSITAITTSPVQVGTLTTWSRVACGYAFITGINSSGSLYSWGINSFGSLGTLGFISPVQLSATTNWSSVAVGVNYALATKTDGTLWGWGLNSYGQLGNNSTSTLSTILQIGTLSSWAKVTCGAQHSAGIQSDGTLWAWGNNSYGQLGQGNYTFRSSPVQVGIINRYLNIYAMNWTTLAETQ